jgi:hypothetical protein
MSTALPGRQAVIMAGRWTKSSKARTRMSVPKNYRSFQEFQREEIRPGEKLGWSIDDLFQDAELRMPDGAYEERETEELDFGR